MRKLFKPAAGALLLALLLSGSAGAARTEFLIPGGETIGLKLELGGVSVVDFAESSPAAKNAGLKKGDLICKIDGVQVTSSEQLAQRVAQSQGRELAVTVRRGETEKTLRFAPQRTENGWRLGVYVRDGINGIGKLMERAVPQGRENPLFQKAYDAFVAHYGAHSRDHTKPYDGVMELLDALSAKGVKLAIVSNKIDFAVKELSRDYFPGRMQVAVGDDPSRRRKPAPDSVLEAMRQMGVTREETVYVGDSDVDVETARNAGVTCCAVSWGFRSVQCLKDAGATHIAATPKELLAMLEAL